LPAIIPDLGENLPRLIRSGLFRAKLWGMVERFDLERCVDKATVALRNLLENERPDVLWGTAHLALIPVLERVARDFTGHVHVSVQDDPLHLLTKGGSYWPHALAETIKPSYESLLRRADSIDSVSPGMSEHLLKQYGRESFVFLPAPRFAPTLGATPGNPAQGFRVFATGSWDCEDAFAALCDGLRKAEAQGVIGPPQIVFANHSKQTIRARDRELIQFVEHLPEEAAVALAQSCHLLYAPYTFKPAAEALQATSFSSKISLYLSACRPVLFHGPARSSLNRFHRDSGLGNSWTNTNSDDLVPLLARALHNLSNPTQLLDETTSVVDRMMNRRAQQAELWAQFDKKAISAAQVA
jgi:hypothetical protein